MRILVTGGAGFIGSAVTRYLINNTEHSFLNGDKLTDAGYLEALANISDFQPDAAMHQAAEFHVARKSGACQAWLVKPYGERPVV